MMKCKDVFIEFVGFILDAWESHQNDLMLVQKVTCLCWLLKAFCEYCGECLGICLFICMKTYDKQLVMYYSEFTILHDSEKWLLHVEFYSKKETKCFVQEQHLLKLIIKDLLSGFLLIFWFICVDPLAATSHYVIESN